jgi:hypothetical protein
MKASRIALILSVLVISQLLARDPHVAPNGGPAYPGTQNVVGTYAGALIPETPGNPNGCANNSLGIFSLVVPTNGLGTGTFVMFAQGRVFTGTIRAAADGEKGRIRGILDATFDFTVHFACGTDQCPNVLGCTGCDVDVTAAAKGRFDVDITSGSTISLGVGARLNGDVKLNIDQGQVDPNTFEPIPTCKMRLNLDGFKQSTTTTSTG